MPSSIRSVVPVAPGAPASLEFAAPADAVELALALGVWDAPQDPGSEPLARLRLPVASLDGRVTVTLGMSEMRASAGQGMQHIAPLRNLSDPSLLTQPLVLSLAWLDAKGKTTSRHIVEVRAFESAALIRDLEALAARTQANGEAEPLMSIARFYRRLQPWQPHLRGARILISGCGSGSELLAVLALGARDVIGVDMEGPALDIARRLIRHARRARVLPYAAGLPGVPECDLVLSRHVIEHVPPGDRKAYLAELLAKLKPEGRLLLEAPNHECPIEPHTDTRFFHWLSPSEQDRAIRYFQARAPFAPGGDRELLLLSSIRGHRNASAEEITAALDKCGVIEDEQYLDSVVTAADVVRESGDTLRLVIRRL